MKFRRIVTGHSLEGKSIVRNDEEVEPITLPTVPGFESYELWSEKGARFVEHASGTMGAPRYFPEEDEIIARMCVFPPNSVYTSDIDMEAAAAEVDLLYPGMLTHFHPEFPGMHATDSVDIGFLIDGELELELDGGEVVHLIRGSSVVQTGTWHAWHNRSNRPAVAAFILLGAKRRSRS
ncbi:cupin domain-containing protein [Kineobactrum salinum]|uniref:Cupin domain-containing protein n=1 Tax=Kineobactrum salinum TaxID=2708301 RepID=A0A6C0U4G0_9GAMM|nr:cupin domain-containing protein [Kineobactrum salinum]QIB66818.1 cupin domain-containing protein [Kineobactrum salinum]